MSVSPLFLTPSSALPPAKSALRAAALAVSLLLGSCAVGSDPVTFDLNAADPAPARPLRAQLRINEPTAGIDLDSDRILVRTGPQEVATLAGAQWAGRLPLLVQSRLTQTFDNANLLRQVGSRASLAADYNLEADIRTFELDVPQGRVEVDIAIKIVSARSGRVAAAQAFTAQEPVASTAGAPVAEALNGALSSVMTQIVAFVSKRI